MAVLALLGVYALVAPAVLLLIALLLRYPLEVFLAGIVTWPVLSLYLIVRLPSGLPDMRYERLLLLGVVTSILLARLAARRPLPRVSGPVLAVVAVQIAVYVLAILNTQPIAEPDLAVMINSILVPFGSYWATKALVEDPRHLRLLVVAIVGAAVLVAMSGFYERAIDAAQSPFPVETGTASGERFGGVPLGRAAGVFGNPAIYGAFLGVGAVGALAMRALASSKVARGILSGLAVLLAYGVFVSFTRSAWLAAFGAGLAAFALIFSVRRALWLAGSLGVAVGLLGLASFGSFSDSPILEDRVLQSGNVVGRYDRALTSVSVIADRPIRGWGPGGLDVHIAERHPAEGFDFSHNTYLTIAADGGVLALAVFLWLTFHWLRIGFGLGRHTDVSLEGRLIAGTFVALLVAYLASGMFLELRFFTYFVAAFWIAGAALERLTEMHPVSQVAPAA